MFWLRNALAIRKSLALLSLLCLTTLSAAPPVAHRYRPALFGTGQKSLENLIDLARLTREGQQDAVLTFDAVIDADGSVDVIWCHGLPENKALKAEVEKESRHCSFVPALIDGKPIDVIFRGTVIFAERAGHPYLHFYANKNPQDLAQGSDYIEPQMVADSEDWEGVQDMLAVVRHHWRTGHAILSITVDADGKMADRHLLKEEPKGLNIGAAAMKAFATARFIPGFRDGKPVTSTFDYEWAVIGHHFFR